MSKKQGYTDEELRRILEESDYEQNDQSNSSDEQENEAEENSDVPDFDNDDSVADPDFFPSDLSSERLDISQLANSHILHPNQTHSPSQSMPTEQLFDSDIFEGTATSHPSTSRNFFDDNSNDPSHQFQTTVPPSSDSDDDSDTERNTGPRTGIRPTTERGMKEHDEQEGWSYEIHPLDRQIFSSAGDLIHIENIPETADVFTIFSILVDDNVFDLMIEQTNIYAEQLITTNSGGRLRRWKPVNREEMKKFLGIYLLTGIIKFPTLECYWKKDPIFYHPLMHNIKMSYNRFTAILRCWHFVDNTAERDVNDRLYKVKPVIDIVMRNCRKLLSPKDCIVVDESMVPFQGRLLIRQFNPNKTHKYGLKIYKATTDDGYVWKYKVYTGQDPQIANLDKPGSVVVELCEELLDQGRMIIADNWYTSLPLAQYLLQRKTDLCGTLRKNRKNLPLLVKNKKLKRGELIAAQKNNVTILKWKDKRDVLMISTCHADEQTMCTGRNQRLKPNMILEYNDRKKGIDLSDELASYYSPIRKTLTWYKKVAVDVLFGVGVINTVYLFNKLNQQNKCTLLQAQMSIVKNLLGINVVQPPAIPTPSTSQTQHFLKELDRKDGKITRRRCAGCYSDFRQRGETASAATNKAKRVSQICNICTKPYCLQCFQKIHVNM